MLVFTKTPMGRYQYPMCFREFSRSDLLKRHAYSGVSKDDSTNMTDSEESIDSSSSHDQPPFGKGEDIFESTMKMILNGLKKSDDDDDDDAEASRRKKNPYIKYGIYWYRMLWITCKIQSETR